MKSLQQWLKDHRIVEVECLIPDITGTARGKFVPVNKIGNEQVRLSEGTLLQDVVGGYCDQYEQLIDASDQDMLMVPDPKTARLVPWATRPTAQIIHDCLTLENEMHPLSSRNVLRRVLDSYTHLGIQPVVAAEVEFYLVDKNTNPDLPLQSPVGRSGRRQFARQPAGISATNEYQAIIDTMYQYCEAQELSIETLTHELGTAQLEVNFMHGNALDMADKVFTFKRTMREVALKHGIYATFMAKPIQDQPGSSMHLHQSLLNIKTGQNYFCDSDGNKTEMFFNFIGGLQKYTPNLLSLYAPNVNSYRRFTKYNSSPINLHWGFDNRTVAFRIPNATAEATRIENRLAGIDSNPYLTIAASLACGLVGIINKVKAQQPYEGNAGDQAVGFARSLEEALRSLTDIKRLNEILGLEFLNAYRFVKLEEFDQFNQTISRWEREHLLLNV